MTDVRRRGAWLLGAALALYGLTGCSSADEDASAEGEPAASGSTATAELRLGPADGRDLPGVDLERIQVGDTAPDFSLASYDEGVVTLSDYRGSKDVILVFYRGHW